MGKSKDKIRRYSNLFKTVKNWPEYIGKKITGFGEYFVFDIKNLGKLKVKKDTMGTFRENFLDGIYLSMFPQGIFEREEPVVIDVGANIGYFTLSFLAKYPDARIYGFEPHPYCYRLLENFHQEYDQFDWSIYNVALSDKPGTLTLTTSNTDGYATMSSIFESKGNTEEFSVESKTLDSFIDEQKIDRIDLIKMDCEGSEYPILYSLSDDAFSKVGAFCIETHQGKGDQENLTSVVSFLKAKGYEMNFLDEGNTGYVMAWYRERLSR